MIVFSSIWRMVPKWKIPYYVGYKPAFRFISSEIKFGKVTEDLLNSFRSIIGTENVLTSMSSCLQYSKDESWHTAQPAEAVLIAHTSKQVCEIAKLCYNSHVPMIPHGTGTGLELGVGAMHGGVCVDLSQMTAIHKVNQEDFDVILEPGVTRLSLNHHLHDTGLMFPVDPGADASLGGMASTSASGTNAVRYGTMKENVLNLEVVLADGSLIYTAGPDKRSRKSAAGYNLTSLFVGSEGTLGLITGLTLRLHAIPETMVSAVCSFPSAKYAVDSVIATLQCCVPIARIEFLDEVAMHASNVFDNLDYPVAPSLFLEFHGSESDVRNQAKMTEEIMSSNEGSNFMWAEDTETRTKLWKARHQNFYAVKNQKPGYGCITTDTCVPISNLTEMIVETRKEITASGLYGSIMGHVGDGNFHTLLLYDPDKEEDRQKVRQLEHSIARRAFCLHGTCTGEHGIGIGKIDLLEEEYGTAGIDAMRHIKQALDPLNIMNPGKIFRLKS